MAWLPSPFTEDRDRDSGPFNSVNGSPRPPDTIKTVYVQNIERARITKLRHHEKGKSIAMAGATYLDVALRGRRMDALQDNAGRKRH